MTVFLPFTWLKFCICDTSCSFSHSLLESWSTRLPYLLYSPTSCINISLPIPSLGSQNSIFTLLFSYFTHTALSTLMIFINTCIPLKAAENSNSQKLMKSILPHIITGWRVGEQGWCLQNSYKICQNLAPGTRNPDSILLGHFISHYFLSLPALVSLWMFATLFPCYRQTLSISWRRQRHICPSHWDHVEWRRNTSAKYFYSEIVLKGWHQIEASYVHHAGGWMDGSITGLVLLPELQSCASTGSRTSPGGRTLGTVFVC